MYLLTLKTDCLKAVLKAHKDARRLVRRPSKEDIAAFIREDRGSVTGIYRKWIITASLLKGKRVFSSIKDKDFYNF